MWKYLPEYVYVAVHANPVMGEIIINIYKWLVWGST